MRKLRKCNPSRISKMFGTGLWYHICYGIESHIPLCCIASFCWRQKIKLFASPCSGAGFKCEWSHCWLHRRMLHTKENRIPPYDANIAFYCCVNPCDETPIRYSLENIERSITKEMDVHESLIHPKSLTVSGAGVSNS